MTKDNFVTGGGLDVARAASSDLPPLIGHRLGAYEVIEVIAEGGMGVVYRARRVDGAYDREVAIKVSRVVLKDAELEKRLQQEVAVLAKLAHPNISALYDAGTSDDGLTYFVMELIDGQHMDKWAEQQSLTSIVEKIVEVGSALAYAHARLIVHRDLKPSNLLIDGQGAVKIVDFGIARLLGENEQGSDATSVLRPLTPRYASPEQLRADSITTASDIYQMGALLRALLTAGEVRSLKEAIEGAVHREDQVLSETERGQLGYELSAIIERCLRSDPDTRYVSMAALVDDLQAWLQGFPVAALAASPGYRLKKFLRRNQPSVLIAGTAMLLLLGLSGIYVSQINLERDRAETQTASNQRVSGALSELVANLLTDIQDRSASAGSADLQQLRADVRRQLEVARQELRADDLGTTMLLVVAGDLEARLGEIDAAREFYLQGVERLDPLRDGAAHFAARVKLLKLDIDHGQLDGLPGQIAALDEFAASNELTTDAIAALEVVRGKYLRTMDRNEASLHALQRAIELLHGSAGHEFDLAAAHYALMITLIRLERDKEARVHGERAVELISSHSSPNHFRLIDPLRGLGWVATNLFEYEAANAASTRALEIARANYGNQHQQVSRALFNLSYTAMRQGDYDRALELDRQVLAIEEALLGTDARDTLQTRASIARSLGALGRGEEALAELDMALSVVAGKDAESMVYLRQTMLAAKRRIYFNHGRYDEAVETAREVYGLRTQAVGAATFGGLDSRRRLAYALIRAGQEDEAREHYSASLAGLKALEDVNPDDITFWTLRSYLFDLQAGRWQQARDKLEPYVDLADRLHGVNNPTWLRTVAALAYACYKLRDVGCVQATLQRADRGLAQAPEQPDALLARSIVLALGLAPLVEGDNVETLSDLLGKRAPQRADIIAVLGEVG
ncbi:MAG: protein kinase [Pseudomonadota bacterium]